MKMLEPQAQDKSEMSRYFTSPSEQLRWDRACRCLAGLELAEENTEFLLKAAQQPSQLEAVTNLLTTQSKSYAFGYREEPSAAVEEFRDRLLESATPTSDWLTALAAVDAHGRTSGQAISFETAAKYVACCEEAIHLGLASGTLVEVTRQYLNDYGIEEEGGG